MKAPFWILYNPCWSTCFLKEYDSPRKAAEAALKSKEENGYDVYIMQVVGYTGKEDQIVELTKEEYQESATSQEESSEARQTQDRIQEKTTSKETKE